MLHKKPLLDRANHRLQRLKLRRQYDQARTGTKGQAAKRIYVYSINLMRALHPAWFKEDLERLFGLLATRAIRPRVAERIGFDEVAEAHRRIEAGGLDGKLVLCPDLLPSRRDRMPPRREPGRE
jgi:hypothetical protein